MREAISIGQPIYELSLLSLLHLKQFIATSLETQATLVGSMAGSMAGWFDRKWNIWLKWY